ncbi:hypothetical protein D1BOALGB6SA_9342 [Olavius sp. associated proteobacterium Delta 1]|nr:hypothetical protein D1BOALGB6SA_9342 [Olavius sp. associated proteobacterium Delta 1]
MHRNYIRPQTWPRVRILLGIAADRTMVWNFGFEFLGFV